MKKTILTLLIGAGTLSGAVFASEAQAGGKPYCREYTQVFKVAGTAQQGYGIACLQPDGSWEIVSQTPITEKRQVHYKEAPTKVYVAPQAPVVYYKQGKPRASRHQYYRSVRGRHNRSHLWH